MQSIKLRNSELEGSEDHSRIEEDDRERPSQDAIALRAYERYEARGREDGHALDDWLNAEQDLSPARPHS